MAKKEAHPTTYQQQEKKKKRTDGPPLSSPGRLASRLLLSVIRYGPFISRNGPAARLGSNLHGSLATINMYTTRRQRLKMEQIPN